MGYPWTLVIMWQCSGLGLHSFLYLNGGGGGGDDGLHGPVRLERGV